MAADQIAELALQLDELQNRVRILVDAEAIRRRRGYPEPESKVRSIL